MPASALVSVTHQRRSYTRRALANSLTLTVLSLGLVLLPVALYWREKTFLTHAVVGHGTVVSVAVTSMSRRSFNYTPTIRFADATGRTWTVRSRAPGRASCAVGQELSVLYDARDPSWVQPNDPASTEANWHFGLAFAIPGLVLLPVGLYQIGSAARELARRRHAATPAAP